MSYIMHFRHARALALKVANRLGISSAVFSSRWRQRRLLVLCYHGVSEGDEPDWSDLYISRERFEHRLLELRKMSANILPLNDALTQLYAGTLPPRSVSITFDDGFCDFASMAVPALAAVSAPSTLYLSTSYSRKQLPVFDPLMSYLLWKGRGQSVTLPGLNTSVTIPRRVRDSAFTKLHSELLQFARSADFDAVEKNDFARQLANVVRVDFDQLLERRAFQLLSPGEVRALDPALVSVQLHTHRHRTPSAPEAAREELSRNAMEIAAMTGRAHALDHFCYPNGHYSGEFVHWLRMHGVKFATTCEPGYSTPSTPPLAIPRFIDTMSVTADTFAAWVSGVATFATAPVKKIGATAFMLAPFVEYALQL